MTDLQTTMMEIANDAKAWPFAEARSLAQRLKKSGGQKDTIIFETGYGPSGLPHIGTFGEVVRTTMVRFAYEALTGQKTRLICFSDDMDGFRKVPDNVPNAELLAADLHKPLTEVRDPFGTHPSFGAHNNARLQAFLDSFGFEYEFVSSTSVYKSGEFDDALRVVLARYNKIMDIMLPTLGEERRATYSPFFPICPETGKVLQAKVTGQNTATDTITYIHPDTGVECESSILGGACKLQWKCDWAMRWFALGVDYEMSGKDRNHRRSPARWVVHRQQACHMNCSLMRMARRSLNPKAMACRLKIGCAMAVLNRYRYLCMPSQSGRSGCIST